MNLPAGTWSVRWYNPRSGTLQTAVPISNGNLIAPDGEDWTALITPGTCAPGTSCNDGDECTNNDVLDASCNCSGTPSTDDADDDGICDAVDSCPILDNNLIGTSCDEAILVPSMMFTKRIAPVQAPPARTRN